MTPRDAVAIILAFAVLMFVLSGTTLRYYLVGDAPAPSGIDTQAWKDIVNVILGALAGYISGKVSTNGR